MPLTLKKSHPVPSVDRHSTDCPVQKGSACFSVGFGSCPRGVKQQSYGEKVGQTGDSQTEVLSTSDRYDSRTTTFSPEGRLYQVSSVCIDPVHLSSQKRWSMPLKQ